MEMLSVLEKILDVNTARGKGSHSLTHILVKSSYLALPSDIFPILSFWIHGFGILLGCQLM